MSAQSKVTAAERELSARQSELAQYQEILDDAADQDGKKAATANVASAQLLVESAERNLQKARAGVGEAGAAERRAATVAAGERATAGLDALAGAEGDIESHSIGLVNALLRRAEIADRIGSDAFDAGMRSSDRNHLLDMRHIDAFLANLLSRSGLAAQLAFVQISGVQHLANNASLKDLTDARVGKLRKLITRATQQ